MNQSESPTIEARVFVLEDDPGQRLPLERILRRLGYEIEATGDPEHGMKIVTQTRFDAFILDLAVPGTDGCKFLEDAGPTHISPNRVIFLTAHEREFATELAHYSKVPLLRKPGWTWESLAGAVRQVLKHPW